MRDGMPSHTHRANPIGSDGTALSPHSEFVYEFRECSGLERARVREQETVLVRVVFPPRPPAHVFAAA